MATAGAVVSMRKVTVAVAVLAALSRAVTEMVCAPSVLTVLPEVKAFASRVMVVVSGWASVTRTLRVRVRL